MFTIEQRRNGTFEFGDMRPTARACEPLARSFRLSPMWKAIAAPFRLHSLLPTGRVHLRQLFQLSSPFTPADQGGELLHVGKGLANGGEATVEARALDLGFGSPWETALVVIAFKGE